MRAVLGTLAAAIAVLLAAALIFIYSGTFNPAAVDPHWPPVRWAIDTTLDNAVASRAEAVVVPEPGGEAQVRRGAGGFAEMCVHCHGSPARPRPEMARHMRPQPPVLTEAAAEWSPAELFWIVKNGIKMTGMPAWGPTHDDETLWSLVAFLQRLPGMSAAEYETLVRAAGEGGGHGHGEDAGHGHGGGEVREPPPGSDRAPGE